MSDDRPPTSGERHHGGDDPLVARLRSGLDALTSDVSDTPPTLRDVTAAPAPARPGRRRWMLGSAAAAVVALTAGVLVVAKDDDGDPEREVRPADTTGLDDGATVYANGPSRPETRPDGGGQRFRAVATVFDYDAAGSAPFLCLGAILESYPPQCGGVEITLTNWSWKGLDHEPAQNPVPDLGELDVRWGSYVVVGTYDRGAQTFTLTEPARVARPDDTQPGEDPDFSTPCAAPEGGWPDATEQQVHDAATEIQASNEDENGTPTTDESDGPAVIGRFAGLWMSRNPFVLNVVIGASAEEIETNGTETAIREFYDGALCLVPGRSSMAELVSYQQEISARELPELTSTYSDVVANQVVVELMAPNPEIETELIDEYGDAVRIEITGLTPIGGDEPGDPESPVTEPPADPGADPTLPPIGPPSTVDPETPVTSPDPINTTYRFVGTVLRNDAHGPQLCVGMRRMQYPPDCGTIDVPNWNWDGVEHQTEGETRWGEYVVIGTFDPAANSLLVTVPATVATPEDYPQIPEPDFSSPCEEPDVVDPDGPPAAGDFFEEVPGFGGRWVTERDDGPSIENIKVVGDLGDARAAIREFYEGPLCLVPATTTYRELLQISDAIALDHPDDVLAASPSPRDGAVTVALVWHDPDIVNQLVDEYGDAVTLDPPALALVD